VTKAAGELFDPGRPDSPEVDQQIESLQTFNSGSMEMIPIGVTVPDVSITVLSTVANRIRRIPRSLGGPRACVRAGYQ
jgi:hypothetical protein